MTIEQIKEVLNKIPANLVMAEHTEFGHFYRYTKTNEVFSSVTTRCGILDSPHLKKWASRLAADHIKEEVFSKPGLYTNREAFDRLSDAAVLVHQDRFKEAGDIGTRGHKIVEEWLEEWMKTGVKPADIRKFVRESDSRLFAIARSAELFCKEWNVIPVVSEMLVASPKHKFAGTLDSMMMVLDVKNKGSVVCSNQMTLDGSIGKPHELFQASSSNPNKVRCINCGMNGEYRLAIIDWKTSNSIDKDEYAMQVSAYWQALYEMTGIKTKDIYIVRLDKAQAKYEVRKVANRSQAFRVFIQAGKIYDWQNNGKDKLVAATPKENVKLTSI